MRFSVQLFALPHEEYVPLVTAAEELGYSTVWLADHVITPMEFEKRYPYSASGDPGYRPETPLADVMVTLGHLAAVTNTIRLATGVYVLPLRNPFHVARAWATLQQLSGGRAVMGLGAGWMQEEYEALGLGFRDRGQRMNEMLEVITRLWSGKSTSYSGRFYEFPPLAFGGAPEPSVPMVFGGHSPPAFRRAARYGSGWFGPNVDLETSKALRDRMEGVRAEAGCDGDFDYVVRLSGALTTDNVQRYADAGFTDLVISPFTRLPRDAKATDRLSALERAREVLDPAWTNGTME